MRLLTSRLSSLAHCFSFASKGFGNRTCLVTIGPSSTFNWPPDCSEVQLQCATRNHGLQALFFGLLLRQLYAGDRVIRRGRCWCRDLHLRREIRGLHRGGIRVWLRSVILEDVIEEIRPEACKERFVRTGVNSPWIFACQKVLFVKFVRYSCARGIGVKLVSSQFVRIGLIFHGERGKYVYLQQTFS